MPGSCVRPRNVEWSSRRSCARIASSISGTRCPWTVTHRLDTPSRYRLPSESIRCMPPAAWMASGPSDSHCWCCVKGCQTLARSRSTRLGAWPPDCPRPVMEPDPCRPLPGAVLGFRGSRHRAGRLPQDQVSRQRGVLGGRLRLLDGDEDLLHDDLAQGAEVLADRRQRGEEVSGLWHVVEAH